MKVKELIEKLKAVDPELTVTFGDSEDGTQVVSDIDVRKGYWTGWNEATTLELGGDNPEDKYIDEKFVERHDPPKYEPNPIMDNLKELYQQQPVIDSRILNMTAKIAENYKNSKDSDHVTFPIHVTRNFPREIK